MKLYQTKVAPYGGNKTGYETRRSKTMTRNQKGNQNKTTLMEGKAFSHGLGFKAVNNLEG